MYIRSKEKGVKDNSKIYHLSITVARLKDNTISCAENQAGGVCGLIRQHTQNLT